MDRETDLCLRRYNFSNVNKQNVRLHFLFLYFSFYSLLSLFFAGGKEEEEEEEGRE